MIENVLPPNETLAALERRIRASAGRVGIIHQLIAEQLGLSARDIACLSILADAGALTAGDLGEAVGLTTGAMTRLIDRLERAGYVRRVPDPTDRRRVMVEPVAARIDAIGNALASLRSATVAQLGSLSEEGIDAMSEFIAGYERTLEREIAVLTNTTLAQGAGGLDFPAGAVGKLLFKSGASKVRISTDRAMTELYRVEFEGPPAEVQAQDQTVSISYRGRGLFRQNGPDATTVILNSRLPWEIAFSGGVSQLLADLEDLDLRGISLSGGVSQVNLHLPGPTEMTPIRISGGVSQFRADRPAGVPVRLQMSGGASNVTVDNQRFAAIGGSLVWQTPDAGNAVSGYDVLLSGGVSQLSIDTRPERITE